MKRKKVVVIGAGPGGLTAAMLLASHGYEVEVFEKDRTVGGRNQCIEVEGFKFDTGPTFLMMLFILEEMFVLCGRNVHQYLDIKSIDPLYRLKFGDGREFLPTRDANAMKEQISRLFPGNYKGYLDYMKYEREKFARLVPCLQVPYSDLSDFVHPRFLRAAPYLDAVSSLYSHLGKFFTDEELKLAFTFQAKYLGMSPWKCPGTFSIISYIEHDGGIHHPIGGLNRISHAMAKVVAEEGGQIHLDTPVDQVIVRGGRAVGVRLKDGAEVSADYVVMNTDFGHAMSHLVPRDAIKKWTPEKLKKKSVSCSGYLLYLGVDKIYEDVPHHSILFCSDYRRNVTEISDELGISEDPSIYVQNASVTDPTLAPEGQSTIYILVPIANNRAGIDWEAEKDRYRDKVLEIAEQRGGLTDLRKHIVAERMITPTQWETDFNVFDGAIFNLGHSIDQMLYFRPHNEFEEIESLYLVGGGTHPGSGLPTIYESGRISAAQILKRDAWYL
ncbi:MAG: phytoene desaturase [Deltaproteobacteria bacterium]|jgi:phytoene desaturase|nr:phytoene desaturase [Deltaproteobacteria bacterium]MBW2530195.1 phytoene desaturase [Deltaproteobacteria bacterium]